VRQLEQPEKVRDRRPLFADRIRDLLLRHVVLVRKTTVG
jgi:hypothetical protein